MTVEIGDTSEHGMNCPALTPGEQCTCALEYRRAWQTEQTMHKAWRKRAEEAEKKLEQGDRTP